MFLLPVLQILVALIVLAILFFSCCCLSASVRADIVDRICDDNDGCDRRYGPPTWGGWYRFTFRDILNIIIQLLFHSRLFTSSRVLVYCSWYNIPPFNPLDVPSFDPLLDYKLERRLVGNSWGPSEKNQKGSFLCIGFTRLFLFSCFPLFN